MLRKRKTGNSNKNTEPQRIKSIVSYFDCNVQSTVQLPEHVMKNTEKSLREILDNGDSTYKNSEKRPIEKIKIQKQTMSTPIEAPISAIAQIYFELCSYQIIILQL